MKRKESKKEKKGEASVLAEEQKGARGQRHPPHPSPPPTPDPAHQTWCVFTDSVGVKNGDRF